MSLEDRWPPHLPPFDQDLPEQHSNQLEVERAATLKRRELLEVVQLSIEDVCLGSVRGHVLHVRVAEVVCRLEPSDHTTRLDKGVVVPPTEELSCYLRLTALTSLTHLLGGERRGAERAKQPDRENPGGDRRHLTPVDRASQNPSSLG